MSFPIFDAHCDTIIKILDHKRDLFARSSQGHIDYHRMLEGNVRCQVFACWASKFEFGNRAQARSLELLAAVHRLAGDERILIPSNRAELQSLSQRNDVIGIIPAIEGGEGLGGKLQSIDALKELCVRYVTLAWGDNELTGSSFGNGSGLTELGTKIVAGLERKRILVDASHMSDAAFDDLSRITTMPIIATHSNARAVCSSPRNLTDDQIKTIAESGGVIGINFHTGFLDEVSAALQQPLFEKYLKNPVDSSVSFKERMEAYDKEIAQLPRPPLECITHQIDHIVSIGGVECVGFGADFDGVPVTPAGVDDCSDFPAIVESLRKRGYSDNDLEKICWENWMRVFGETL